MGEARTSKTSTRCSTSSTRAAAARRDTAATVLVPTRRRALVQAPGGRLSDRETFLATYEEVGSWLDGFLREQGIPYDRTVLGGFSMGAVMAYSFSLGARAGRGRLRRPRFPASSRPSKASSSISARFRPWQSGTEPTTRSSRSSWAAGSAGARGGRRVGPLPRIPAAARDRSGLSARGQGVAGTRGCCCVGADRRPHRRSSIAPSDEPGRAQGDNQGMAPGEKLIAETGRCATSTTCSSASKPA